MVSSSRSRTKRLGIEIFLLLGGIALISLLVIFLGPSILSWTEQRAHDADAEMLTAAVVAYRVSPPALRPWPTLSGRIGQPREGDVTGYQCDNSDSGEVCSWIDIEVLVNADFLSAADIISSADATLNVSATNAPDGQYGWYVNELGEVASEPPYSRATGYP